MSSSGSRITRTWRRAPLVASAATMLSGDDYLMRSSGSPAICRHVAPILRAALHFGLARGSVNMLRKQLRALL
jgi:hypothetical protein